MVRGSKAEQAERLVPRKGFVLAERPGYLLHKAALMLAEDAERALAAVDLQTRDFFVLASLASAPDLSQQDLSRLLNLDPTTVVAVIDELERREYVERKRNPEDRRRYILTLTDAGRGALAEADRVATEIESAFFGELKRAERDALREMLGRVMSGRWPESICTS